MRHYNSDTIVLLGFCSFCREDFRDGVPRFIDGDFPLEQFCSSKCAGNFLKYDLGAERVMPTGSAIYGPGPLLRQEQGE